MAKIHIFECTVFFVLFKTHDTDEADCTESSSSCCFGIQECHWLHAYEDRSQSRRTFHTWTVQPAIQQHSADDTLLHSEQAADQRR